MKNGLLSGERGRVVRLAVCRGLRHGSDPCTGATDRLSLGKGGHRHIQAQVELAPRAQGRLAKVRRGCREWVWASKVMMGP